MIITKAWLSEFIDISAISTKTICEKLDSIGLEVDSLKSVRIPKGVVVAKVVECIKHPDADKLNITKLDIGNEQLIQVVCGAKNVKEGLFVALASVGTQLEKIKISKAKLRGVESFGMICSASELGLGALNDGILELDSSLGELILGKQLSTYPSLNDDIIDIELTANRGDCLSTHGVARELSASFDIKLHEFEKHIKFNELSIGQVLDVQVSNDLEASLAYMAVNLSSFSLPLICKLRLGFISKYYDDEIKSAKEYAMHSTGVLSNVYPKGIIKLDNEKSSIEIKKNNLGFDCVYSKDLELSKIGISPKEMQASELCVLETSYIDPEIISKKVFESKIKTGDFFYKSSRGSEPDIMFGLDYFSSLLSNNGALIYNGVYSFVDEKEDTVARIAISKINKIIGEKISQEKIEDILKSLGFGLHSKDGEILNIIVPRFRHDIKNIADVTEEIVRIIGIDNIKAKPLLMHEKNKSNLTSKVLLKKNKLRNLSVANGFYETLTYAFTSKELLQKYGFELVKEELDLLNPISQELDTLRTTMFCSLLEACKKNYNLGFKKIAFFELGRVFDKNRNETEKMSFIYCGDKEDANTSNKAKPEAMDFFSFARLLQDIIGDFELAKLDNLKDKKNLLIHPYQSAKILQNSKEVGFISRLHLNAQDDFSLPPTFIAELNFELLKDNFITANSYSKFQSSTRDLSVLVPKDLEYTKVKKAIQASKNPLIKKFSLVDIFESKELENQTSLTLRFWIQSNEKTLEDEDLNTLMNDILELLKAKFDISLR